MSLWVCPASGRKLLADKDCLLCSQIRRIQRVRGLMKDQVLWTTPQSEWQGSELNMVSEVRLAAWQLQWCRCMSTKFRKAEKRVVSSVWWGQGEHESELNLEERIGLLWLDGEGGFRLRNNKDTDVWKSLYIWGGTLNSLYFSECSFNDYCFLKKYFLFFWCGPFLKSLLDLLQYCFCFMFCFFGLEACGILVPWPGIEP